jgi:CRP-like cAMP-binding protein
VLKIDKAELLGRHFLFRGLEAGLIARLVELSRTRHLARDEVVFRKGDEGGTLYGVLEGAVRIAVGDVDGKEIVLNVMEPGDVFGEIALLDGLPRTADASAVVPSEVVEIHRPDFMLLMKREPKLSAHIIELLCERLRWVSELVEDAAFLPLSARLAKRVLALAVAYGKEGPEGMAIELALSQEELARMAGGSRERVSKLLAEWSRSGFLRLTRSHVIVRKRAALEQIARGDQSSRRAQW